MSQKKSNFINKQRRQRERAKERQRQPRLEKSFPFKLPFSNITSMYSYWLACKVNVIPHPIWWSFDSWRVPSFIHTLAWIQSSADLRVRCRRGLDVFSSHQAQCKVCSSVSWTSNYTVHKDGRITHHPDPPSGLIKITASCDEGVGFNLLHR